MTTFLLKKNNVKSVLGVSATDSDLTITVSDGSIFPATGSFSITIWDKNNFPDPGDDDTMEILLCTSRTGNVLTVTRAQEDTVAVAHGAGNAVEMLFTAGQLEEIEEALNGAEENIETLGAGLEDLEDTIPNLVPYTGATANVALGTYGLTGAYLNASAAASGPKLFVYNTSGGGSSLSLGAGGSLSYLQFPSSKVFMLAPVSDITASPSSSDGKLIVDNQSVYIGAYGTLNGEALINWGHIAIGDNGTNSAKELRFYEPSGSGSHYSAFKAQAQAGNLTYTLPAAHVTNGILKNDGSGNLSWATTITVADEAYSSSWDSSLEVPTKNAVYDKIESLVDLMTYSYYGGL